MQLSIYWNLRHAVALTMVFPREKESGWMDLGGWAAEGLGQLKLARVAGNTLKFIKFSFAGNTISLLSGQRVATSL